MIEGDCVDDIFLEDFFVGAFVAEELGEFVVGGFGGDTFLHLFFLISSIGILLLLEYSKS